MRDLLEPEDRLLIGTDLVKDEATLEAAYNDSAGVTAEFNRNVLRVINSNLDGDLDPARFDHVAFYDEARAANRDAAAFARIADARASTPSTWTSTSSAARTSSPRSRASSRATD